MKFFHERNPHNAPLLSEKVIINIIHILTHMRKMKVAVATLPLTRPTWVL